MEFQAYKIFKELFRSKPLQSFLLISVVVGALITIGKFSYDIWDFYYNNIADTKNISDKIEILSAGQSINYFKQILGNEITSRNLPNDEEELIFKYKTSYFQTVVNEEGKVIFFSVTDCKNPIKISRPAFMSAYSYETKIFPDQIKLNRTTFETFFGNSGSDIKYFLSGATANSYYYETVYSGNPGNYQTLFAGNNDICADFKFEHCMLNFEGKECTDQELENFRKNTEFNTYGESAPGKGSSIINLLEADDGYFYLGPDRVQFRVFQY